MYVYQTLGGRFDYKNVRYKLLKRNIESAGPGLTGSCDHYISGSIDVSRGTYGFDYPISKLLQQKEEPSYIYRNTEFNLSHYDVTTYTDKEERASVIEVHDCYRYCYDFLPEAVLNFNVKELIIPKFLNLINRTDNSKKYVIEYFEFNNKPTDFIIDILKCKQLEKIIFEQFDQEHIIFNFETIIEKLKDTDLKFYTYDSDGKTLIKLTF